MIRIGKKWLLQRLTHFYPAAAVENMFLTATVMILNIRHYVEPIGLLPLGYPAEKVEPKSRMSLKWVTHKNRYNISYY